jgi:thymidylate synthase ThyX
MNKISAKIIADSVDKRGNRITSYILTYPRFIHSELMTHRMFSRNAASSRAIPLKKMLKMVEEDPFVPIAFQKKHKGMQGTEYIEDEQSIKVARAAWLMGVDSATAVVKAMDMLNITKQLCNRLLEPYTWYTVLVTATEYDNFFELRCPQYPIGDPYGKVTYYRSRNDYNRASSERGHACMNEEWDLDWAKLSESHAEIHIQALAEAMWDARNKSTPDELEPGDWHIPFGERIDLPKEDTRGKTLPDLIQIAVKIGTARAARLSYMTFDGNIDYKKDIKLHDTLLASKHMSPFEHCARIMTDSEYTLFSKQQAYIKGAGGFGEHGWCNNFRGFIPYRYMIE